MAVFIQETHNTSRRIVGSSSRHRSRGYVKQNTELNKTTAERKGPIPSDQKYNPCRGPRRGRGGGGGGSAAARAIAPAGTGAEVT